VARGGGAAEAPGAWRKGKQRADENGEMVAPPKRTAASSETHRRRGEGAPATHEAQRDQKRSHEEGGDAEEEARGARRRRRCVQKRLSSDPGSNSPRRTHEGSHETKYSEEPSEARR